jgi:hypothetical protein
MIEEEGIHILELEFPDGSSPPKAVIKEWLRIVKEHFGDPRSANHSSSSAISNQKAQLSGAGGGSAKINQQAGPKPQPSSSTIFSHQQGKGSASLMAGEEVKGKERSQDRADSGRAVVERGTPNFNSRGNESN